MQRPNDPTHQEVTSSFEVEFDSRQRTYGTNDNPIFQLIPDHTIIGLSVKWVQIPYSFHHIDLLHNLLYYTEFDAASSPPANDHSDWLPIRLAPGSYSTDSFPGEFKRAVNHPNVGAITAARTFESFFNKVNNTLTVYNASNEDSAFGNPNNDTKKFALRIDDPHLAEMLGCNANTVYVSQWGQVFNDGTLLKDGASMQHITFPYVANFIPNSAVSIHSRALAPIISGNPRQPDEDGTKLITIPITGNYSSLLNYQTMGNISWFARGQELSTIDFFVRIAGQEPRYAHPNPNSGLPPTDPYKSITQEDIKNHVSLNNIPFKLAINFYVAGGLTIY